MLEGDLAGAAVATETAAGYSEGQPSGPRLLPQQSLASPSRVTLQCSKETHVSWFFFLFLNTQYSHASLMYHGSASQGKSTLWKVP